MARIPAYFEFRWAVPTEGFRWHDVPSSPPATERGLLPNGPSAVDYYPLREYTGLFLRLAEVEPTEAAIREFANQYGTLENVDPQAPGAPRAVPRRTTRPYTTAPPWPLQPTGRLARDFGQLGEVIERLVPEPKIRVSWLADWQEELQYLRREVGSITGTGLYGRAFRDDNREAINEHIRTRLAGHISPWVTDDNVEIMPTTLLGAVWLQLALAFTHNKKYKRCEAPACPRVWFEVSKSAFGLRAEARFCSASCRTRAWLARKAQEEEKE